MNEGPTSALYGAIEHAYNHFNATLFEGKLPKVLFTVQRQKNVMGYFSLERWTSVGGDRCHEIAINPAYIARAALLEVFQTLCHEMAHCFQHCYGNPSRTAYHNKEWADHMESIGLMPSATGLPGGARTGQKMNDYPLKGGAFIRECDVLVKGGFGLPWVDRQAESYTPVLSEEGTSYMGSLDLEPESLDRLSSSLDQVVGEEVFANVKPAKGKVKSKYSCEGCSSNVWGKPGLRLACLSCDQELVESA